MGYRRPQRRNYFPEPHFQFRYLRFLAAGALLQICATVAMLYYFLNQNYVFLVKYAGLDPQITQMLFHELNILIGVISFTFLIYLAGILFLGVLFSHRIAGVIYALKRTIREINSGKDAKLQLRQGDEFQELADLFNTMLTQLRGDKQAPQSASQS